MLRASLRPISHRRSLIGQSALQIGDALDIPLTWNAGKTVQFALKESLMATTTLVLSGPQADEAHSPVGSQVKYRALLQSFVPDAEQSKATL